MGADPVPHVDPIRLAADSIAETTDTDVFFYNSPITRNHDDALIAECCERKRRTNVLLVLVTEGGDPDAAYRIARCFQDHYERFTCLVPGYCKSAGTLITTGAHELVMSDAAELGPLDIQMTKKDELWETQSGLTVIAALDALRDKSFSAFEYFFLELKRKSKNTVTFKTAAEIAGKLVSGLYTPIFQQIDPMHVGEASRSQAVALHYGMRLALEGKNIDRRALESLISLYPAHGFVIDRAEATGLFNEVRIPNEAELNLIEALEDNALDPLPKEQGKREFLSNEKGATHVEGDPGAAIGPGGEQPEAAAAVAGAGAE